MSPRRPAIRATVIRLIAAILLCHGVIGSGGERPRAPVVSESTDPRHHRAVWKPAESDSGESSPRGLEFISFRPVRFERGNSTLSADAMRLLDERAEFLRLTPGIKRVLLVGHTDRRVGHVLDDDDLALRRAISVRDYLIEQGVPPQLIHTTSHGSRLPIDEEWTAQGQARNRRVEMYVVLRR
jgi:outer membrane protein OmpA-like peptidoglycan-associated protein